MVEGHPLPNHGRRSDDQARAVVDQDALAGNLRRGVDVDGGGVPHNGHRQSGHDLGDDGNFLVEESVA